MNTRKPSRNLRRRSPSRCCRRQSPPLVTTNRSLCLNGRRSSSRSTRATPSTSSSCTATSTTASCCRSATDGRRSATCTQFLAARPAAAVRRGPQLRPRQRRPHREGRRASSPSGRRTRKTSRCPRRRAPPSRSLTHYFRYAANLAPPRPRAASGRLRRSTPPTSSRRRCPAALNYDLNALALLDARLGRRHAARRALAGHVPRHAKTSTTFIRCSSTTRAPRRSKCRCRRPTT